MRISGHAVSWKRISVVIHADVMTLTSVMEERMIITYHELFADTWDRTKRSWCGGKWERKVDYLVSHGNMSQHIIALNINKLHSANKHFKSCFLVVWPNDLTKHELRLFTRRHYDDVVSASLQQIHFNTTIKKLPLRGDRWTGENLVPISLRSPRRYTG